MYKYFQVHIFNPSLQPSRNPHNVGQHKLIKIWGDNVNWQEELREELQKQVGDMLITGTTGSPFKQWIADSMKCLRKQEFVIFFIEWLESINQWTCWSWNSSHGSRSAAFGRISKILFI